MNDLATNLKKTAESSQPESSTAESRVITRSFRVGRYTVTVNVPQPRPGVVVQASCLWSPRLPPSLTDSEQAEYERGLAAALEEIAS